METSKKVDLDEPTPSNTNILDKPSRDDLDFPQRSARKSSEKQTKEDVDKIYPTLTTGNATFKRRVLKGTILQWIFGLLAYGIACAIFIPMFLHVRDIWADKEPAVTETAAVLKQRLADLSGKNDSELAAAFANNLGSVFVEGAYANTSSEMLERQTTQALGMLASSLPVETAMKSLVPLSKIAKLTANGNETLTLLRVASAISQTVGNSTDFMDRIRLAMAGLASYTADRDASAILVPQALGGAMYQALNLPAMSIVDAVSASFFDVATENYLDEMFDYTWIALVITEVVVITLGLLVAWCRSEPELVMYNDHFKIHWFLAAMLLAPVGIFYAAVPTFQITYDSSTVKNLYVFAACLVSLMAVIGLSSPIVWLARSWYKDCNKSVKSWQNNYFIMAPWHFCLVLLICGFHVWCYFDSSCTIAMDYISIFFTVGCIGLEFSFYAMWILMKEHRQDYYAGFWPAGRMLGVFFITFLIIYVYSATKNSKMLTSQSIVSHLNLVVFGATIDFFLLPVIQAMGRKFRNGRATFSNCDIVTLPTENLQTPDSDNPIVV